MGDINLVNTDELNVLITIDTEIWCDGWNNIDAKFPEAFKRYIYGPTSSGDYGLPFQLKVLNDNGLKAVYFVEPLFATRFGTPALEEIVGLITEAGQSVELHLHTEWVDESISPLFPYIQEKRQHIRYFTYEEQFTLMTEGIKLLKSAGAETLNAYRAGSFGANNDTLRALSNTDIAIDSSFNSTASPCKIAFSGQNLQPKMVENVLEVPMSIFVDGLGKPRPAQLTACSFGEMKAALNSAHHNNWSTFVILSHSFELLDQSLTRKNKIVARRFVQLCEYLSANSNRFSTVSFSSPTIQPHSDDVDELHCPASLTLGRFVEQAITRVL